MGRMSYLEFRRRTFNEALLECLCGIHNIIIEDTDCNADGTFDKESCGRKTCAEMTQSFDSNMAMKMARAFYDQELDLKNNTVTQTKTRLIGKNSFIDDVITVCESIADEKAAVAKEEELDLPEELVPELSDNDQQAIDQVFDTKTPDDEIGAVRDAMVQALEDEDKKAEEIRQAVDMTKSMASSDEDGGAKAIEEACKRMASKPTSLFNAILTRMSTEAVKDVFNESGSQGVGKILANNRDEIKKRSLMMYSLYEMTNAFNIHHYTPDEVKEIAFEIYHNK